MLDSLFEIFLQADRGFVVMRTETGDLIPMWTKVRREDDNQTIRVSRTIIQEVMIGQQAILSADAATDERFDLSQSVADFRIRSMMYDCFAGRSEAQPSAWSKTSVSIESG